MNYSQLIKILLVLLWVGNFSAFGQEGKDYFYQVLSSQDKIKIDAALLHLQSAKTSASNRAYQGALLMKKADFQKGAAGKIQLFKKGMNLLEKEIESSPANVEFRFLRFTIQEHAPAILKYNKQVEEDAQAVATGFAKQDPALQSAIRTYARQSKRLSEKSL